MIDEKKHKILQYQGWRQKIELDDNFSTTGYVLGDDWEEMQMPKDLTGKSFLDVGSNDGLYAFMAEQRGAKQVVAADLFKENVIGSSAGTGWPIEGIKLAKEYLNSKVEIRNIDIYDLNDLEQKFDFVFCSNVLSWLNDIPKAVKILGDITAETLIIRDGLIHGHNEFPFLRYEVDKPYLYRPNKKFMEAVLKEAGFNKVKFVQLPVNYDRLPLYKIPSGTKVYYTYNSDEISKTTEAETMDLLTTEYNDRSFIKGLGWVHSESISKFEYPNSKLKSAVEKVLGSERFERIKQRRNTKNMDVLSFSIIANR